MNFKEFLNEAKAISLPSNVEEVWQKVWTTMKKVAEIDFPQKITVNLKFSNNLNQFENNIEILINPLFGNQNLIGNYEKKRYNLLQKSDDQINPNLILVKFYNELLKKGNSENIELITQKHLNSLRNFKRTRELELLILDLEDASFIAKEIFDNNQELQDDENFQFLYKKAIEDFKSQTSLGIGYITLYVDKKLMQESPDKGETMHKKTFIHELTHAADPSLHAGAIYKPEESKYYRKDPSEINAKINELMELFKKLPQDLKQQAIKMLQFGIKFNSNLIFAKEFEKSLSELMQRISLTENPNKFKLKIYNSFLANS